MEAELDVCPVCGFVKRARAEKPGLCTETWRHPGSAGVEVTTGTGGPGHIKGQPVVTTDSRARTGLVRVHASWVTP